MRIDFLKSNLRHIALLAKECREKITPLEALDVHHLQQTLEQGERVSTYDRTFLTAVSDIKRLIHQQLDFFSKKIINEFATDDKSVMDIDPEKVELARKLFSPQEMSLLTFLFKLIVTEQKLGKDDDERYREVAFSEIEPALDKFVQLASRNS